MNENNINLASAHIFDAINFTDPLVQQICLEHWDFDHDGIFPITMLLWYVTLKTYFRAPLLHPFLN